MVFLPSAKSETISPAAFLKAPFEPFGKKPFAIGGVKNFSLFEGESPSSRNSAAGCKRPREGHSAEKTSTGETNEMIIEQ